MTLISDRICSMIVVDVPTKVKVHKCPHCGHEYWNSRKNQHLFCDSPRRICNHCQKEFIDKDLYVEWSKMTDKQKRFFIHWNGESHRILLAVYAWFCFPFALLTPIGFILSVIEGGDAAIVLGIMTVISVTLFIVFYKIAYKKFHFMKNYLKVPEIVESLKRTGDYDFSLYEQKPLDENVIDPNQSNSDDSKLLSEIEKKYFLIQKQISRLKKMKDIDSNNFAFIQETIFKYNSSYFQELSNKAKNMNDVIEKKNFLLNIINELDSDLDKQKKI